MKIGNSFYVPRSSLTTRHCTSAAILLISFTFCFHPIITVVFPPLVSTPILFFPSTSSPWAWGAALSPGFPQGLRWAWASPGECLKASGTWESFRWRSCTTTRGSLEASQPWDQHLGASPGTTSGKSVGDDRWRGRGRGGLRGWGSPVNLWSTFNKYNEGRSQRLNVNL